MSAAFERSRRILRRQNLLTELRAKAELEGLSAAFEAAVDQITSLEDRLKSEPNRERRAKRIAPELELELENVAKEEDPLKEPLERLLGRLRSFNKRPCPVSKRRF